MIKRLNEWLAIRATLALGTMWCAYAFVVLCMVPVLAPAIMNQVLYVSNCFQLVFLPLLMVGQNLLGRNAETRAQQDHEAIMAELGEVKEIHAETHKLVVRVTSDTVTVVDTQPSDA